MVNSKSAREILKESEIEKGFERCFQNCVRARERLRRCVVNALDAGMTRDEIMIIADKHAAGDLSICSIIMLDEILRYERSARKEHIAVVKERKAERRDA